MIRFFRASLLFCLGLVLSLAVSEWAAGWHIRHGKSVRLVGGEVYGALKRLRRHDPAVRTIFLGDSVARQLFTPGTEPRGDVRFLTTNQAISMAGQYDLLESAIASYPKVKDVYFFYLPGCFANNLPPELSHDYYCGYFHCLRDVREVFEIKHDVKLTAAHLGRWLLPNLMLLNSGWNLAPTDEPPTANSNDGPTGAQPAAPDAEPLLTLASDALGAADDPPPMPAGTYGTALSAVSEHYLQQMKYLCQARGVTLHVLSSPLSAREHFLDPRHVYANDPMRVDPGTLMDAVHFQWQYVAEMRARAIAYYCLPLDR